MQGIGHFGTSVEGYIPERIICKHGEWIARKGAGMPRTVSIGCQDFESLIDCIK